MLSWLDNKLDVAVEKVIKHLEPRRLIKYTLVSLPMTVLGIALLAFQVRHLGASPRHAYIYGWFVMTPANYVVNRIITWNDREVKQRRSAVLWVVVSLLQTGAGQATFRWLIGHDVWYLLANVIVLMIWSPVFYILKNKVVFKPSKEAVSLQPAEVPANA